MSTASFGQIPSNKLPSLRYEVRLSCICLHSSYRTQPLQTRSRKSTMAVQLYTSVSLNSKGQQSPTLGRNASVAVPSPVLRSLSNATALRSTLSTSNPADFVDITFRLYTDDDGHFKPVSLPESTIAKSLSKAHSDHWDAVFNPSTLPNERDAELSNLLGLPAGPQKDGSGTLQSYASILLMTPVRDDNLMSALKIGDPQYGTRTEGVLGTLGFRTFLQEEGADVSPWHDVALRNDDGTLNFVCEIPKDTSAKFEVATGERSNPIKQDVKKGAPRFYPYSIPWNYGMLPQTWEDPQGAHAGLPGVGGDNDPVDVVEIGGDALATAGVYNVKVLGAYAMIDGGELDWKIICIRTDHPLAPKLSDITDMERELPGELEKIMVWFRDYKIPDGKPANAFGFGGKPVGEGYAKAVVEETHQAYSQLRSGARANDGDLSLQ